MTELRLIRSEDIPAVKKLADANRTSVGFVTAAKFHEAVQQRRAIVAVDNEQVIGFVLYRHRKIDRQTTLSEICVHENCRCQHIGSKLVAALIQDCEQKARSFIQLKCPTELPANEFYRRLGFMLHAIEAGKKRPLNVWRFVISQMAEGEG
jgi:ribosomal protein S18 acetylase RimI-like enzyme